MAACEDKIQEGLVAFLQHELSTDEEAALQRHLETCSACREELESCRSVCKATKKITLIEPSAAFRKNLQHRISEAVEHTKRSKAQKRPGSTAVRLPSQAAITGEAAPPSGKVPLTVPLAKSARATARAAQRKPSKTSRFVWVRYGALAAAVVLFGLTLSSYLLFPSAQVASKGDPAGRDRFNERRDAQTWDKILGEDSVSVPEQLGMVQMYIVDLDQARPGTPEQREQCVIAMTEQDLERERRLALTPEKEEHFRRLIENSMKVQVSEGRLVLPTSAIKRMLGGAGNRVTIVRLNDRVEIWPTSVFENYIKAGPQAAPAAVPAPNQKTSPEGGQSGVPTEAGKPAV